MTNGVRMNTSGFLLDKAALFLDNHPSQFGINRSTSQELA